MVIRKDQPMKKKITVRADAVATSDRITSISIIFIILPYIEPLNTYDAAGSARDNAIFFIFPLLSVHGEFALKSI